MASLQAAGNRRILHGVTVMVRKKILNFLHPLLKPLSKWYLSKTHIYTWQNISVKVYPGVFHPGLFFSTKILLQYLQHQQLKNLKVLELGAGSGLISIYLAKQGAIVTSSDINPVAIKALKENFSANNAKGVIIESDLFTNLKVDDFDLIIINPPYYPKRPLKLQDHAWYCGENFEYFNRLFSEIASGSSVPNILMILSKDCDIEHIQSLANKNRLSLLPIHQQKIWGEENTIYNIKAL